MLSASKTVVGSRRLLRQIIGSRRALLSISLCVFVAASIGIVLFQYTENLLRDRLQDRLIAIAATAAIQFDHNDIDKVNGEKDMHKKEFRRLVSQLQDIRSANDSIKYAYIMRRTSDPLVFEFVADADALSSPEDLDENQNGFLDDEELPPFPGDPYEVGDYPVLRDEAFYHPSVDRELQPDQWGLIMAAYAPIYDDQNNAVAIIGLDVFVDDFLAKTRATFLPFILFIVLLVLLISLLSLVIIRMYLEREEDYKEIDRQKDELMSMVSHQLATPVSSVRWYLEMLHDGDVGKLTKNQKDHIGMMQNIVVGLTDLVQMILDVSRIQMGRMKVDVSDVELGAFFSDVLDVIEPKAKEKKVDLQVHLPKNLPTAKLDKRLTRMAVQNVLSNAVKYTPAGGHVDFSVAIENKQLQIAVQDTGCGIPEEEHDKVFGRLFRASNVRDIEGNGFGLYLAKGGIDSQGGNISFTSKRGAGTTFVISVPCL